MENNTTVVESNLVIFDFSDPWQVSAVILFGLLATVAVYRSVRACCVCSFQREQVS